MRKALQASNHKCLYLEYIRHLGMCQVISVWFSAGQRFFFITYRKGEKNMTVKEFMAKISTQSEACRQVEMENVEIWSDEACKGYVAAALGAMGLPEKKVDKALEVLDYTFENLTLKEAEEYYQEILMTPEELKEHYRKKRSGSL